MEAKIDTGQILFFSNGENLIDYTIYGAAGGVGEHTSNVMPSAEKQTIEFNGMTLYCDGQGRYTISGRNNSDVEVFSPFLRLKSSFTIPICYGSGNGTISFWTTGSLSSNNSLYFYNNLIELDHWNLGIENRQEKYYYAMADKDCNAIQIKIEANYNGTFTLCPHITDDGKLPTAYEPYGYKIPITCGGVTTNIYLDEPLYEGDSITFSTAQVDIPTNNGQNTLTVDTQVKPSKIIVKTNKGIFQNPPENPPENKSSSDHPYNRKMNTRNEILRAWATKDNERIIPKSWNHVQFLVKHGLHKDVFHIGDELVCKRGNEDIIWQVIGMDIDEPVDPQYKHSLTLCMKYLLSEQLVFSARQALFYFPDGLSAGTYYFTITQHTWVVSDVNKSFYFTLTNDIPKKGQIVLQNAQNVSCENKTLKTYSSSTSTTEIETATMYLWDNSIEATFLGNVNNSLQTNINCLQRAFLGNNNYKESYIRQWINGGEKATLVYQPQTVFDRPPSWNNTNAGLLKGMDNDFLKVVQSTKVKTARNTLTDGGGSDITEDKFFLLSRPQAYGGNTVSNIDEGNVYPYFKNYSSLNAASTGADKNRIKTKNGSATWWWLRSPGVPSGSLVWCVNPAGRMNANSAMYVYGVAAACNIFG